MPSEYITKPKSKPKLPPPSFKYGSNTYVVLAYAKMKNKNFSIEDVRSVTARYTNDYEVKRSIEVLLKNGSVVSVKDGFWKITPKGIQQIFDFASRREVTAFS